LDDKLEQLNDNADELARNKDSITKFFETREAEHREFVERREEYTQLITALKDAKQTIASLATTSFLQLKDGVLAELKAHHAKVEAVMPHGYKTLALLLLELTADANIRADPSTVQVILDVIDELIESIYSVQKEEIFADDEKTRYYQADL
jgi:hypothetical protein